MDRFNEIKQAYSAKHRTDRGRIRRTVAERIGLSVISFDLRMSGKMAIADSEIDAFLEELKLPKE